MAETQQQSRRRHRLDKMTFDEISFVDRGMNQHAHVLIWKQKGIPPSWTKNLHLLTDDELTELGKAFHLPGQASGPDDCPEGWSFDAENRMCVRKQRGEDDQRDGETPAQRRRRLREERRLGPRSRVQTATGRIPTGRVFLQQRFAARAHYDDCVCYGCVKFWTEASYGKQQEFKTVGGERLPKGAFAFVDDPDSPSTWKLPLFETAADVGNNRPSIRRTAAAATALTGAGFRGQRVQIPNDARSSVKSKILAAWLKARKDADQEVTREDAPAILKRDAVSKVTTVMLREQESGGASPHTHTVDFPDGAIGPGTWESSEEQGHTHAVIVTDTVMVGDSIDIMSEIANPEPPEGVEQHAHALTVDPVESTANPPEEDEVVSQRNEQTKFQDALDAVRITLGKEPSAAMRKQLFDEVRAKASREDAFHVLQSRIEDLSKSMFDILFLSDEEGGGDPTSMLNETMQQFLDATSTELTDILSGRIIKEFGGLKEAASPPEPDEFRDMLLEFFEKSQTELVGENKEEKGMDLSKLTPEDRALVEKALEAAGLVETLNKSLEDATSKISELEKLIAEHKDEGSGDDDDVTKGLPAKAAAFVKSMRAENELLAKQVKEMADFSKKAVLREEIVSKLGDLAVGTDAVMDALWSIDDSDVRDAVLKILEAASVAVSKAGAYGGQLGSDAAGTAGGSASAKFDAIAKNIVDKDPKVTMVEARARAITENPELYDEYMAEAEPNRYSAHRAH